MTNLFTDKLSGGVVRHNTQCMLGDCDEEELPELERLSRVFVNPSSENPMKASEFLQFLDARELVRVLRTFYKREPEYPLIALLKSLVYKRLMKIKWFTTYEKHLNEHPNEAVQLGFRKINGVVQVPNHETFRQLENERLGPEGYRKLRLKLVEQVIATAKNLGLVIGENVGVDSTPLEAKAKDNEAAYNDHYKKHMYKSHVLVDLETFLPLAACTTIGTAYDGHSFQSLVREAVACGARPERAYGDQHYGTYENYAFVNCELKAKARFRLAVDDSHNEDGELAQLRRVYQTFWRDPDFKENANDEEMLQFLYHHGEQKQVGAVFRNLAVSEREECPDGFFHSLYPRSACEGSNSIWKEQLDFEHSFKKKGLKNAAIHTTGTAFAVLLVALTRLQHGITNGLARVACLV